MGYDTTWLTSKGYQLQPNGSYTKTDPFTKQTVVWNEAKGNGERIMKDDPRNALVTAASELEKIAPKLKRIRQDSRPLLNKLESDFLATIKNKYPNFPPVRSQAVRFKLSNGSWYKVDFFCASWPQENGPAMPTAWETKGNAGKNIDRGKLALKVAAFQYPEIAFYLVWKDPVNGSWQEQRILP